VLVINFITVGHELLSHLVASKEAVVFMWQLSVHCEFPEK